MQYLGEIISLAVAFLWTGAALSSEFVSKRWGVFVSNVWRMLIATSFIAVLCWFTLGAPYPVYASGRAWFWLALSGGVGYAMGDYCLFKCYILIGSLYGQLFMTLAPAATAFAAWFMLGQHLTPQNILAMTITLSGIALSILGRGKEHRLALKLPWQGVLFAIGAGMGQGVGLVLSKIGLDYYEHDVPSAILPSVVNVLPFSANMIRCIAGFFCFLLIMWMHQGFSDLKKSSTDARGFLYVVLAVLFGPFVGVGLSLMAVQYTAAGIASTLMALTPIIIILPSHWLFGTPVTAKGVLGALISCVGVSLFFL